MEQPEAEIVYALMDRFSEDHYKEICQLIDQLPEICSKDDELSAVARERGLERCIFILDSYQEQPHLIDPKIPSIVDRLLNFVRNSRGDRRLFYQSFQFLRVLIKVRGYKTFARYLPHENGDLIPVLRMLEEQRASNATIETAADICIAEYVLMIWISMLCKIPFDFSRFDSSAGDSTKTTSQRIFDAVKPCLITQDQRREAAAYCLSIFVARPDSVGKYLRSLIFDDILPLLAEANGNYSLVETRYGMNLEFVITARCLLLAGLLKRVKREEIPYDWSKEILEKLFSYSNVLSESTNILIRKLTTKIVVRTALTMLKPKVASWRYERGSRSLATNLTSVDGVVGDSKILQDSPQHDGDETEEEQFEIPEEIESVINYLLTALKDKDTVCRWSAAKGFGRLCARLPHSLADQIVSAILAFFQDDFADASRHGSCLALAELGRRGLLVPSRLEEVVPLIVKALTYDEQRGTYSVGSNVRDAACYVCWSFARAYAPVELRPYNLQLAIGLLTTAVYDREVNCRRAASAAFQEHVGRQRGEFPHGIDLLTEVDYFAVRNRKHCYRELSVFVAKFSEYTRPMIDHLMEQKICHWDEYIRQLAGDAMRQLSAIDPTYVASNILPKLIEITNGYELFACQGAVLALGRSASALSDRLSTGVVSALFEIPERLISGQLFKGVGGELMRKALNDYIGNLCSFMDSAVADSETKRRYAKIYRSILDENLTHQREDIRVGARTAAEALFAAVPPTNSDVVDNYAHQLEKAVYERQRMGACLALSSLPRSTLIDNRSKISDLLIKYATIGENKRAPDASWALARRDCLFSLTEIAEKFNVDEENGLTLKELESIIDCYTKALDDYTTDSRGDIGSVVREASICGLKKIFSQILFSKSNRLALNADLSKRAIRKILQQCCEKIDRTRELACDSVETLLREAGSADRLSTILHFSKADVLMEVFVGGEKIDWTKAGQAYPKLIELLNAGDEYAYPVLLGFAVTVGGMTESSVRSSSDALLAYVARVQNDGDALRRIVNNVVSIFEDYRKIDRVTLPLMKMIDQIFTCNYLDNYLGEGRDDGELEKLLDLCIGETRLSKSSPKVLVGLSVCNSFLRYEGSVVATKALRYALSMLTHTYPRVRREAANRLYESVLSYFTLDNHNELALTLLSETDWDAEPKILEACRKELEFMLKAK